MVGSRRRLHGLDLNSVALGFLVEIDNMLFHAVVQEDDKAILENFHKVELRPSHLESFPCILASMRARDSAVKLLPPSIVLTLFMSFVAFSLIYRAYFGPFGKLDIGDALACLCQVGGHYCFGSQILGGSPHLPTYLTRHYRGGDA